MGVIKGDTRSLDYSSHEPACRSSSGIHSIRQFYRHIDR